VTGFSGQAANACKGAIAHNVPMTAAVANTALRVFWNFILSPVFVTIDGPVFANPFEPGLLASDRPAESRYFFLHKKIFLSS
jgi:hypothetical protein